ncbi:hypothetical protein [Kitasatospora sp. NBC_01300]|uniref:hypothetical protein n=1 Tax=Kitasatospora sp. NBC_01300 TaxID=2903574 RepID=UPI00352D2999|nr:hypothetical protein OG556_19750 [Kitasatospora sp. NBC_01300]
MAELPPVEYAVAVERYLAASGLAEGSRRIYRIALNTWAWALADRPAPTGPERRRARPPVLPLALLDHPDAARRLRTAADRRRADTDPRTLNRELSTLRAAVAWWRAQRWLDDDPTTDLHPAPRPGPTATPLTPDDLRALFALRAPLREQSLWHLLHESGAAIDTVLALDTDHLDLPRHRTLHRPGRTPVHWRSGTARLLPLLVAGRTAGPLFLTDRRAPAGTPAPDRCPHTGRARLSYRRAAELLTAHTAPLTPGAHGWTLRQLRPGTPPSPDSDGRARHPGTPDRRDPA